MRFVRWTAQTTPLEDEGCKPGNWDRQGAFEKALDHRIHVPEDNDNVEAGVFKLSVVEVAVPPILHVIHHS